MPIIERSASTLDLFEDIEGLGGPDERLWTPVVFINELSDSHDEFFGIVKYAAPQSVLGEVAEEAFDHVQPRTAGGREVDMKPGMTSEPSLHFRMFVGGVVVNDQVKFFVRRRHLVNHAQELQPLLMAMPVIAHADNGPIESIYGSEQSGCPVPFVVVSHRSATTLFDRQSGLRPIQRLNLTLLVGA